MVWFEKAVAIVIAGSHASEACGVPETKRFLSSQRKPTTTSHRLVACSLRSDRFSDVAFSFE